MPRHKQSLFEWLFTCPTAPRSARSIVGWWERRRLAYNLIVISALYASLLIGDLTKLVLGESRLMGDAFDPWPFIIVPVAINLCYTIGWIFELVILDSGQRDTGQSGPKLLRFGLLFSLFVVCLFGIAPAIPSFH